MTIALVCALFLSGGAFSLLNAGGANADGLRLRLSAGRSNPPWEKILGNSTVAQAQWTNKQAHTGKFSVLLEKDAPLTDYVFAGATIEGLKGSTVADLGDLGLWAKGGCGGGAPRFNLYYDNDGDGGMDGVAFYGCGNHIVGAPGTWTQMLADASAPESCYDFTTFVCTLSDASTVVQLSVIVDEPGTYYVDDISVAGVTLGEPSDK